MNPPIKDIYDDLELLLEVLPARVRDYLKSHYRLSELIEIVLDLGAKPEVRFLESDCKITDLDEVTQDEINDVVEHIGKFNSQNRAGIGRTLHRISAIRNREGKIIGLTCRVGRAVVGTIEIIRDVVESGKNLLLIGPPGIGKTTKLREIARVLSDEFRKRVIIVDTSNEIAGDGDIPHPGIGTARRMQVPTPNEQHDVMIEAVENHMPQVIVIDEIGTEAETQAARTIAERGVQLVATAHGQTLENIIKNPTLADLVGGVQSVTLGDEEAKFRGTQKAVLERKGPPTFDVLIEIQDKDDFAIYHEIAHAVDDFLRHETLQPEIRRRTADGIQIQKPNSETPEALEALPNDNQVGLKSCKVYAFGLSTDRMHSAIHTLNIPVKVVNTISEADLVLCLKDKMGARSKFAQLMKGQTTPVHVLKKNTFEAILNFFRYYYKLTDSPDAEVDEALREIEKICTRVAQEKKVLDATARPESIRRIQMEYIRKQMMNGTEVGEEGNRRIRVYPR